VITTQRDDEGEKLKGKRAASGGEAYLQEILAHRRMCVSPTGNQKRKRKDTFSKAEGGEKRDLHDPPAAPYLLAQILPQTSSKATLGIMNMGGGAQTLKRWRTVYESLGRRKDGESRTINDDSRRTSSRP